MSQLHNIQLSYTKADIQLAISEINSQRVKSVKRAAEIYNVPRTTVVYRRAGRRFRRDCEANLKRLNKLEEEAVVTYILNESTQGFAPTKADVRVIANKLTTKRSAKPISKN